MCIRAQGLKTTQGGQGPRDALYLPRRHRHPGLHCFRRPIPRLYAPLSTLHVLLTAVTRARLGVRVDRYSLPATDLHQLPLADLPRPTVAQSRTHAIAVCASWPALPSAPATRATGRPAAALPRPVSLRPDCTSFRWRLRKVGLISAADCAGVADRRVFARGGSRSARWPDRVCRHRAAASSG
jgi:hypothetical protein